MVNRSVLPLGLKSAPYILTKITRPLLKKWRGEEKCTVLYLDDGIGLGRILNQQVPFLRVFEQIYGRVVLLSMKANHFGSPFRD